MNRARAALHALFRDSIPTAFFSNAGWQYVATFGSGALSFLWIVATGAMLGSQEFGRVAIALGFVAVCFQLVELRLHEAVIRYAAEFREKQDPAGQFAAVKLFLLADAASGVLAFAVVILASPLAARYLLKDPERASLIVMAGLAVLFQNVTSATSFGVYRTFDAYRAQAVIFSAGGLIKLVATLAAIGYAQADALGVLAIAAAAHLLTNAFLTAGALRILRRHVPEPSHAPISVLRERYREIARFVGSTYILSLSMIPTKELDVNLLGYYAGPAEVGVYKVAKTFLHAFVMAIDPAFFVIYPQIAAMWMRGEIARVRAFIRSIAVIGAGASLVLVIGGFVLVPIVITRFVDPEYAASGVLFRWMIGSLFVSAPLIWVNPLLMAANRPDLVTKASIAGSTVVVVLYLLLIPPFQAKGSAIVQMVSPLIVSAITLALGMRTGILPPRGRAEHRVG